MLRYAPDKNEENQISGYRSSARSSQGMRSCLGSRHSARRAIENSKYKIEKVRSSGAVRTS
jgi:hypothetical protein